MDGDDEVENETDPILVAFGSNMVGRIRSGETGVLSSVEAQTSILDAMVKIKDQKALQPLKQIFEESKAPRVRAHKLDRLVAERISASQQRSGRSDPVSSGMTNSVAQKGSQNDIFATAKQTEQNEKNGDVSGSMSMNKLEPRSKDIPDSVTLNTAVEEQPSSIKSNDIGQISNRIKQPDDQQIPIANPITVTEITSSRVPSTLEDQSQDNQLDLNTTHLSEPQKQRHTGPLSIKRSMQAKSSSETEQQSLNEGFTLEPTKSSAPGSSHPTTNRPGATLIPVATQKAAEVLPVEPPKESPRFNASFDIPADVVDLQDELEYRLSDALVAMKATVRMRSRPDIAASEVGLVTTESIIQVDGMTPKWFRVVRPVKAWVLRASPDGQKFFERMVRPPTASASASPPQEQQALQETSLPTVKLEEFEALMQRVTQLEDEMASLKNLLRSV